MGIVAVRVDCFRFCVVKSVLIGFAGRPHIVVICAFFLSGVVDIMRLVFKLFLQTGH